MQNMKLFNVQDNPARLRRYDSWLRNKALSIPLLFLLLLVLWQIYDLSNLLPSHRVVPQDVRWLSDAERLELKHKCANLHRPAGPTSEFLRSPRKVSDRYVNGTKAVLIRNAKILTSQRNGTEVVFGDILLDKGLVVGVGYIPEDLVDSMKDNLELVDMQWKNWITPGLVDLHSHIGVSSAPGLDGARDGNSRKMPIQPWLRSIDGLNSHDEAYLLSISGGITSAQVLPGSANNIGGQAFWIKLRQPDDKSVQSMVLEPPAALHLTENATANGDYIRWRHMKHACGENPSRRYSQTRMDSGWEFRRAYNEARKIMVKQDEFCHKFEHNNRFIREEYPDDLQWESLVDVLRGHVKLSVHCYEAVDLDAMVRLTNEFKFPIASFHHAGETYLVPDLLKSAFGGPPAAALFANNARKKREAYRNSEFAPAVLSEHGIPVVMKSDHPVLNSRYLMFEAQQAHYYGLNPALALASVTSTPADAAGLGWRIGRLAAGYDADLVVWDSHPLNLGATPTQVYIDGIPQLSPSYPLTKPNAFQQQPAVPDWSKEHKETVEWDGLPPLEGREVGKTLRLRNVRKLWRRDLSAPFGIRDAFVHNEAGSLDASQENHTVIIQNGRIASFSPGKRCQFAGCGLDEDEAYTVEIEDIDLEGGSVAPGLTTFGSALGLTEIDFEPSTSDGIPPDPLAAEPSKILGSGIDASVVRAADGLQFGSRDALMAFNRGGATKAVTAPSGTGFMRGLAVAFRTGALNAVEDGAIVQLETALHISISMGLSSSVSTQIAALRRSLLSNDTLPGSDDSAWQRVREGVIPLVIQVESADIMATLLNLKSSFEQETGSSLRMTFTGANEAWMIAPEIAEAGVSVILTQPLPFPYAWEAKRILPGPPLTPQGNVAYLLDQGVKVATGVNRKWEAVTYTRFNLGWVALESNGTISEAQALALATTSLEEALGLDTSSGDYQGSDMVLYKGGDIFEMQSKVVGVISQHSRKVQLF